jgi:TolB-like protein/tetratricopeptide (TPR) repeat protein
LRFFFNDFTVDTDLRELRRDDEAVAVEPQVFDLLVYLLENRDRIVTRDDLIAAVWKRRAISDSALDSRINAARKAIGDNGKTQKLIRTIVRKGVRFVGAVGVERAPSGQPQIIAAAAERSRTGRDSAAPSARRQRPTIVVLPFINMSVDPGDEFFADGITEDIITALSRLRWFSVIARNSSFIYKGRSVPISQLAQELGVDYVVEGSVRKEGERVRISAQLNDVATGSHVWAERYDRELAHVFAVQDEITGAVVTSIEPQLYAAEHLHAHRRPPDSLDAWGLVMRALSCFWRLTQDDNRLAQSLLERAIEIDPGYGQAHSVLATSQMFGAHLGWADVAATAPVAEQAARAALRIDSEDPWAHNALGSVLFSTRRLDDSLGEFELALRLNPNFSLAQSYYALALCYCGRWQEADAAVRRAMQLSPRDPILAIYCGVAAYAQFIGRNYEEAISLSREAIRQRGDFVGGWRVLTVAAAMTGQTDVAATALEELRRSQPGISLNWIANALPWKQEADREHYLEAFRRAGLT